MAIKAGSSEADRLIEKYRKQYPAYSKDQLEKYLIKKGQLEQSSSSSSSSTKDRSGDSQTFSDVKEQCAKIVTKSEHYKEGFLSALIAAQTNIMRNNQDQLFFETANLVTNKPTGSSITKVQLRNNLTQFVFGDKDKRVLRTNVRDAGKFKHIIYLTIITQKKLLTGARTQESTFQKIKDYADLKKNILSAIALFKGNVKCKKIAVERKGVKKILGKTYERECTQQQWANVYLTFPDSALKKVIETLVFDEGE